MTRYLANQYEQYKSDIPEGQDGPWCVEQFTVTEEDEKLERMRAAFSFGSRGRFVPAGTYTKLTRNGFLVMSDTPDEIGDHMYAFHQARGRVLVNGLGLGIFTKMVLNKPEVSRVVVVEIALEVINLVGTHLKKQYGDRLILVCDDALTWKPPKGAHYDVVWHDIWDDICIDNLESMKRLHRRYGRRCDWQGSWCRERCEWLR